MSPTEAAPVTYHWPWTRGLALFLPAIIILPFLLIKPNRRAAAWLMLIPQYRERLKAVFNVAPAPQQPQRQTAVAGSLAP